MLLLNDRKYVSVLQTGQGPQAAYGFNDMMAILFYFLLHVILVYVCTLPPSFPSSLPLSLHTY
jgi:hypothetical protein